MKSKNIHDEFKPDLTPKEMLELGIFVGNILMEYRKTYLKNGLKTQS
jgi:hypothetical protein